MSHAKDWPHRDSTVGCSFTEGMLSTNPICQTTASTDTSNFLATSNSPSKPISRPRFVPNRNFRFSERVLMDVDVLLNRPLHDGLAEGDAGPLRLVRGVLLRPRLRMHRFEFGEVESADVVEGVVSPGRHIPHRHQLVVLGQNLVGRVPASGAFHRLRRTSRALAEKVLFAAQFHEPAAARSSFRVPGVWLPHRGLPASIQCNKGASCSINPAKHGSFRQLDVLMGVRLIS